jgi:integrase/recombinase XerD
MADPSEVGMSGPLASLATGFASSLVRQGYTPNSAISQLHLMAHLSRWLAGEGVEVRELRATDVERFLSARCGAAYTHHLTGKAMRPLLTYLRDQGLLPPPPPAVTHGPVDVAIERYRQYLTKERGLQRVTARGYVDAVRPFLRGRASGSRWRFKPVSSMARSNDRG